MIARSTFHATIAIAIGGCDLSQGSELPDLPDAPGITECTTGAACGGPGEICTTADTRCECAAHGGFLVCESLSCPDTPVEGGTPCTMVGLTCDPDFEFAGYRCTGPENVFVECLPGGTIDSRCPFTRPTAGAPCCWLELAALEPCEYAGDDGLWSCVSSHWVREPAP